MVHARNPYVNIETEAYCAGINILAVEYLVIKKDDAEYSRRVDQMYRLNDCELSLLCTCLSLNCHISTVGAMITQGDYPYLRDRLLDFLDEREGKNGQ